MSLKLVWMALESELYRDKPCAKLLLISLCNFAQEDGQGWAATGTLAKHASCTPQYVRKLKIVLAEDGLVDTRKGGGRGKASTYQINIQLLSEIAQNKQETEFPLLNQQRGNSDTLKGKLSARKGETGGAPIGKKDIKGRAREALTSSNMTKKEVPSLRAGENDIGAQAHVLRKAFSQKFGEEKTRAWFDKVTINAAKPSEIIISVPNAFGKTKLEALAGAWLHGRGASLNCAKKDVRAA